MTSWTYDNMGRVTTRTLPMGQTESFQYDLAGRLQSQTDFNGDSSHYSYSLNDQVESIFYADGTEEHFTYDANGNRLTATQKTDAQDMGQTTSYVYDSLSRLIMETKPTGETLNYHYDANGNKTQLTVTYTDGTQRAESMTYDALNRLQSVTANNQTTSYGYDAVGNRTSISYPNGNSQQYSYDSLNRLTKLESFNGQGALIQSYDYTLHPTGRRTQIDELSGRRSMGSDSLIF